MLSDAEYVTKWLAVEYRHKAFNPDTPPLFTENGERVRSKSEVIIAETLRGNGVPYRYEHFGKMDDPEYVMNFLL